MARSKRRLITFIIANVRELNLQPCSHSTPLPSTKLEKEAGGWEWWGVACNGGRWFPKVGVVFNVEG